MNDFDLQSDLQVQQLEAEVIESFNKLQYYFDHYSSAYLQINFEPNNSKVVNTFFRGLDSLQYAFASLNEAIKTIAEIKGVKLEKC